MDHLSRWSVRLLLSREILPEDIVKQTGLRKVATDTSFIVYENPKAFPVAAFTQSPMRPVPIEYHANRIRLQTAGATGTVFLRIAPIAGYHMMHANGQRVPVTLTESGVLLAIQESRDVVDIVYRSSALEWGIASALIAIMLTSLGFLLALAKTKMRERQPSA
jgi:hypothetical protein